MKIKDEIFKVIVKPNSRKNGILGYDEKKQAYLISIKEKAEDNKANIALIRFLSKMLGRKARIKSGLKSREKLIKA